MAGTNQAFDLEEFVEQPLTYSTKSSEETDRVLEPYKDSAHFAKPHELEKDGPGRPENEFIIMYKSLQTRGKPVKKDNERTKYIRAEKKCVRCILNDSRPKKGIIQFDRRDTKKKKLWEEMEQFVLENDQFNIIKDQYLEAPDSSSYSNEYCQHFYMPEAVRVFHFYSAQLVYGIGEVDPTSLSTKLKMSCCDGRHSVYCSAIWEKVRHYVMFDMIFELGLEPIGTNSDAFHLTQQIAEVEDPYRYLSLPNP